MHTHPISDQSSAPQTTPAVTKQALIVGTCLTLVIALLGICVRYIYHGSQMTYSHIPMALLIGLVVFLASGALITRLFNWHLSTPEWHCVLIMGLVAATIPSFGLSGYLIGYLAAPYYFATDENNWEKFLHPHMPTQFIPSGEGQAIAWFFEGLPQGASIPWGVWLLPLLWWTTVIGAAFVFFACVAVILRKQWVQHERLMFPAITPLIDMVSAPGDGTRYLPTFARGPLFWIGFGIAFGMIAWNCFSYFMPGFPAFPIYRSQWVWLDRQYPPIHGFIGLFTLFFAYFASLDVLLSIWLFDLLFIAEGGILNQVGFTATSPYYARGVYHWQTAGAFVVLVASVFWVARRHLYDVFQKAWSSKSSVDDSQEWFSYRTALLGLFLGFVYLTIWLVQLGFTPIQGILLLITVLFVYVGMARIMADTGLPYTNVPVGAWDLIAPLMGNQYLSPLSHVAYRFSSLITGHFKGLFLPALVQSGRISDGIPHHQRRLPIALALAFGVSFVVCIWLTLFLGYHTGAYNFDSWEITRAAESGLQKTVDAIKKWPKPLNDESTFDARFFGVGSLVMGLLIYLRHRLPWWPLHPVGFAISGSYLARRTSFTIFLAWLIKFVLIKIGGVKVYKQSHPLFVGLLVGYVLGVLFSTCLDMVYFPEKGHPVHRF